MSRRLIRKPKLQQRLLSVLDGGYERETPCDCSKEHLHSTKITLAEFPLYTERSRIGCLGCGVVFTLFLVAVIFVAIFTLFPLTVAIPVGACLFICGCCGFCSFFVLPLNQHRHVVVELECLECGHKYTMIYDAIVVEKRERCGHYSKECDILDVSETKRSYGFVEAAYGEMRDGLDFCFVPGAYTCKTWADDFYQKIC